MSLLLSAERLYSHLATAFAGPADELTIRHHLYACFGIPLLHGDMQIAYQVSPEFAAELASLAAQLMLPPVSAEAWLEARLCWPQPCFIPHEVHLAMAGVLFATQARAEAFRDTSELDLARFRDFLVAHFGPLDAALIDIPLTALECAVITGDLPDRSAREATGDNAAELAQQMQARLGTMPALLWHRQHGPSFDILVRHADHVQQADIIVSVPPYTAAAVEGQAGDTVAQESSPACVPSPMASLLLPEWMPETPVWPCPGGQMIASPPSWLQTLSEADQKRQFEHWYGTIPAPRPLLVDFARCVRDGSICRGDILAIAHLIHISPPSLLAEEVLQTGLLSPETIQNVGAQRLLRRLTPGVLFALAAGFAVQPEELV